MFYGEEMWRGCGRERMEIEVEMREWMVEE